MDGKTDGLNYRSGPASMFVIAARHVNPSAALEACIKLVEAIAECDTCNGKGRVIDEETCPHCGGLGVMIGSRWLILSEALPLALEALDEANQPFENYLRDLLRNGGKNAR